MVFIILNPEDETDRLSETSVGNYDYSLRNNAEKRSSQRYVCWDGSPRMATYSPKHETGRF